MSTRKLDARPDTVDFRDRLFVPTLIEVPPRITLEEYQSVGVPILDQGTEGACTGFGLATVCNYLLRTRDVDADETAVSPYMLYQLAKRYDEWPGEDYEGSSARGAMKAWHKHGVCGKDVWRNGKGKTGRRLSEERAKDATARPLGAYFRVNHKDLVAMHAAISEVGVLYATAIVHSGWSNVGRDGTIRYDSEILGGHAFAIVAYDADGLWIQNSWGNDWGKQGFARISYEDWLENGTDVWVARLGAPIRLAEKATTSKGRSLALRQTGRPAYHDLRPHVVSVGNDGRLRDSGPLGTGADDIENIFEEDFPRITANWKKKRILLYAHGGLVSEEDAINRVADYRDPLLNAEIYPLAFVWRTDFWATLCNILQDGVRKRQPEGILDDTKDFLLDRLDDSLEPIARALTGRAQWKEMKENALLATTSAHGAARLVAQHLATLLKNDPSIELHIAAHSAGSIFHAPLVQLLSTPGQIEHGPLRHKEGYGVTIDSLTLWAPACTVDLFKECYLPAIQQGHIDRFALFTLTDDAEQDDHCANIYHKSLLYLVSHAFEEKPRIPLFREGEAILGMAKFVERDPDLKKLWKANQREWVQTPNQEPTGSTKASTARHHGDFDDDPPTVAGLLARIVGTATAKAEMSFPRGKSSMRAQRGKLSNK